MEDIVEKPEKAPPEQEILVNIVSKIPEEKQEEIAAMVCSDYDDDISSRSDWEEKRENWYKLWACSRDIKNDPWPGCSNVCIPILATAANQFHSRAYQAVFTAPGVVKAMPVSGNDIIRAKNSEQFLNWQIQYEMEEYEEVFDKLLQILPINGTHFKKLYYSKDLERPISEHIYALDLVLPYRTKSIEEARRSVHRVWLYYDELKDRDEQGLYENFDKIPEEGGKTEDDANMHAISDGITGENNPLKEDKPRLILECHRKYDLGDGVKPYIFTVDYDSQTLLRATSRIFEPGNGIKKTLNYFIDYHFIPNPDGFYSFGFGHFLEPLNEMANTAFNQIFDSGRLTNQPFGFYGRRAGIKTREIKLKPGLMHEVEDASQVYFPTMQRVDQILFMVLNLIEQYWQQFTSVSDYTTGRESSGTKTPTAHGTLAIIEQGLVTFSVMTKRIFRSLRKELRLIMALDQLFLPDTKEYRVMGSEDKIAFPDIKRSDFDGVKDVIPIGDPSYASKQMRQQEALALYQVGMSNPYIIGNPQLGIKSQPKIMHELWSDLVDSYDKKNKSKLIPEIPVELISPEEENAMFMQGDYSEPKSGEDHLYHIKVHSQFERSPMWAMMPDEYKELHVKHGRATSAMQMKDMAAKAMMGEQVGPVAPIKETVPQTQPAQQALNMATIPTGGINGL